MAVEARRGCGYRQVGGLYMVSGRLSAPCGRLPLELHVCPTCQSGIRQSRGWTWVNPAALLAEASGCSLEGAGRGLLCTSCPVSPVNLLTMGKKAGLLWVGGQFYPEASDFMREAAHLGISKRIPAIPRGFKLGEHWVLIAHPKAVTRWVRSADATEEEIAAYRATVEARGGVLGSSHDTSEAFMVEVTRKGVLTIFQPTAIEKIVTKSQYMDTQAMTELEKRGITPVPVPDNDPDHGGTPDDDPQQELSLNPLLQPQAG